MDNVFSVVCDKVFDIGDCVYFFSNEVYFFLVVKIKWLLIFKIFNVDLLLEV